MEQWDREYILQREVEKEIHRKAAIILIKFSRAHGVSDIDITDELSTNYGYDEETIKTLFAQAEES